MTDPEPFIQGAGPNGEVIEPGEMPEGMEPAEGAEQ